MVHKVTHGGGGIIIWDFFSSAEAAKLDRVNGIWGAKYRDSSEENLKGL